MRAAVFFNTSNSRENAERFFARELATWFAGAVQQRELVVRDRRHIDKVFFGDNGFDGTAETIGCCEVVTRFAAL